MSKHCMELKKLLTFLMMCPLSNGRVALPVPPASIQVTHDSSHVTDIKGMIIDVQNFFCSSSTLVKTEPERRQKSLVIYFDSALNDT